METAVLSKRVWLYIINLVFHLGIGFALASPFLKYLHVHIVFYFLISAGFAIIFSFFFDIFLLSITKGYTLGSAILGVKYVASDGKRITMPQIIIRSGSESILIFALIDFFYLVKLVNHRAEIFSLRLERSD